MSPRLGPFLLPTIASRRPGMMAKVRGTTDDVRSQRGRGQQEQSGFPAGVNQPARDGFGRRLRTVGKKMAPVVWSRYPAKAGHSVIVDVLVMFPNARQ